MSAALQTLGERACRYAAGAETVMSAYAEEARSDLAWGLELLAQKAAAAVNLAIEGDSVDALENASLRCCKANAIVRAIAYTSDNDMLLAAECLMEVAKLMLDDEVGHRIQIRASEVQAS